MAYAQITTRCNMRCRHCCYSCTREGEDMSIKVFRQIILQEDEALCLGGGEPTIHPRFWDFLALAIAHTDTPWLATNGKRTDVAIALAKMAQKAIIGCALSYDDHHEEIDPRVVRAFEKDLVLASFQTADRGVIADLREIRDVGGQEFNSGRCDFGDEGCPCDDIFIKPSGIVHQCGCEDSPVIGSVQEGYEPINGEHGVCHHDLEVEV